jgi:cephalosporin hydroxylase
LDNLHDRDVNLVPINNEWVSQKNVEYIIGNAYTSEIANKLSKIDILIDDGPHSLESHIKLLELYIPKMNSGGVIVIEDVSYSQNTLINYLPEELKSGYSFHDFGVFCDNKIITIEGFK